MTDGPMTPPPPPPHTHLTKIPGSAHESYLIACFKRANDQLSDLHKYPFLSLKKRIQTFHTVAIILSEFNFKFSNPGKCSILYIYISKEIMLTIYPLTL